ncbi:MAG: HK97 gp10 family phage protein [Propionibacteriaceae bacterium]
MPTYRGYTKPGSTAFQRKLLNRRLERISRLGEDRAEEICRFIAGTANELAPVNSNPSTDSSPKRLRGSYKVARNAETGGYAVVATARYWVFVEFGTAEHGDAQPHVRPAVDAARARWKF